MRQPEAHLKFSDAVQKGKDKEVINERPDDTKF